MTRRAAQTPERRKFEAFLDQITRGQYLPTARWLREMLRGLCAAASPVLMDIAERLDERKDDDTPRRLIHVEKRLSRHLNSDRLDDNQLEQVAQRILTPYLTENDGRGVVVAVDLGDLEMNDARPDAPSGRGMQYAAYHKDGSKKEDRVVMGYQLVQIEATRTDGVRLPLALQIFSGKVPGFRSQNHTMLEAVAAVRPTVGRHAWWVLDRGFDSNAVFADLDDKQIQNWAIRLRFKGDNPRSLIDSKAKIVAAGDLVRSVKLRQSATIVRPGRRPQKLECGFTPCWVRDSAAGNRRSGPERTLVIYRSRGEDPVALLVSRKLEAREVPEVITAYIRRWTVEEAARRMKESRGWGVRLEDVRVLKFRGLQRMMALCRLLYLFLGTLGIADPDLVATAVKFREDAPADTLYRLFRFVSRSFERWAVPRATRPRRCATPS